MQSWQKNLFFLWLSQLLVLGGYAAMIPFIPLVFKNDLQITDQVDLAFYITMFTFLGTMGYTIFCPIWGKLADRFGVKPMLLRGTFVTAFIFPLMAYTTNPWVLILLRFLSAACAGTTAASQIMVARTAPFERQGFAQGILSTAYWGGMVLGNVAGGFIIFLFGWKATFWACGLLYFLAGIFILFTEEKPLQTTPCQTKSTIAGSKGESVQTALPREVWALLFLFLVMGGIRNYDTSYLAIKVETITGALDAAKWTGIVSAVVCGGAIVSGVVAGYLADRLKPVYLLTPAFLVSAGAFVLEGVSRNLPLFTVAQTVVYFMAGALQPVLQKQLTQTTPWEKRGSVFGLSSMFNAGGGMLAAVVSGWVFSRFSVDWIYFSCAIIYVITWPVFLACIPLKNEVGSLTSGK